MPYPVKKTLNEVEKKAHLARFDEALARMNLVSNKYHNQEIKFGAYIEQLDAIMNASGWEKNLFHQELQRRKINTSSII